MNFLSRQQYLLFFSMLMLLLVVGCQSNQTPPTKQSEQAPAPVIAPIPTVLSAITTNVPPAVKPAVRVKAGSVSSFTDSQGNVWLADQGFNGGDVVERPDLVITNTAEPEIYRSEHYSMDSFSWPLPKGNYLVKLHFCETYDGITGPGQRVFSFNVQGRDFKDFDVWAKAGAPLTAYVETIPVEIKDGKLLVTFTSNIENPQVNGIEIIPQP